jgi:hypothetical protein
MSEQHTSAAGAIAATKLQRRGYSIRGGVIHVHQTGAQIPLTLSFLHDFIRAISYFLPLSVWRAARRIVSPGPAIWFTPHRPHGWYMIWNAAAWIGARMAKRPERADVAFYFEDATEGRPPQAHGLACINAKCDNVSKSHVAAVFEAVFGYSLAIDPSRAEGPAVEKGEINGAHDGRLVQCPCEPLPGRVYQRLIETGDDAAVEDLRTPCVGGEPVVVFVKRRPKDQRFANFNTSVQLADPAKVFTAAEREKIAAFAAAMNLDWGGLDVLRDRESGRIYIVDVNKTDMPPLALSFAAKVRSTRLMGMALERLIKRMRGRHALR